MSIGSKLTKICFIGAISTCAVMVLSGGYLLIDLLKFGGYSHNKIVFSEFYQDEPITLASESIFPGESKNIYITVESKLKENK